MNLASFLVEGRQKYGEFEQLIFIADNKKTVLTNVEINNRAQALASSLISDGVKKGDVIGVCVGNVEEIPELMNGVMRAGAAYLPIIFMLTPKEIRYIFEDSQTNLVITEQKLLPKIKEAAEGNKLIKKIVVIGLDESTPDERIISYSEFKKKR